MKVSTEAERHFASAVVQMGGQFTEGSVNRIMMLLKQALRLDPRLGSAHLLLGRAYDYSANHRLGWVWWNRLKAHRHFRLAVDSLPSNAPDAIEARLLLGASMGRSGSYTQAREFLLPLIHNGSHEVKQRALVYVGVAAFRSGRIEEAVQNWTAANKIPLNQTALPGASHPAVWLRYGYRKLAARAMKRREYATAIRIYDRVIALGDPIVMPSDYMALHQAYSKIGEREKAMEAYDRAHALHHELAGDEEMAAKYLEDQYTTLAQWGYVYDRQMDNIAFDTDDRYR